MELVQSSKQMGTENPKEDCNEHVKVKDLLWTPSTVRLLKKEGFYLQCEVQFQNMVDVIVRSTEGSKQKKSIEIQRNKKQQNFANFSNFHRGFQAINAHFQITDLPNHQ